MIGRGKRWLHACPCMDGAGTAHIFGPVPEERAAFGSPLFQGHAHCLETWRSVPASQSFILAIHQLAIGGDFLRIERAASLRSSRSGNSRNARRIGGTD